MEVILGVVILTLWTGGAVLGVPALLSRASWPTRYPRFALVVWAGAVSAGLLAALSGLVWSLVRALTDGSSPHVAAGPTVVITTVVAWSGLAATGALAALVLARADPLIASHQAAETEFALLAARAARTSQIDDVTVFYVDAAAPVAMSLPGARRSIVVTSALDEALTDAELRAVLAHEKAHLDQRHGRIAQLARLNAACVPRLAAARLLERHAGLLLELVADDVAVRQEGAATVAAALSRLGDLCHDEAMSLRAARVVVRHRAAGHARSARFGHVSTTVRSLARTRGSGPHRAPRGRTAHERPAKRSRTSTRT